MKPILLLKSDYDISFPYSEVDGNVIVSISGRYLCLIRRNMSGRRWMKCNYFTVLMRTWCDDKCIHSLRSAISNRTRLRTHNFSQLVCTYVLNANASAFKWIRILTEKVRLRSTNRIHYSLWSATSSSGIFTGGSGCGAPSPSDGDTNMGNVDGIKNWEKVEQRSENREVKLFIPPRTMILLLNYRVIETSMESAY